MAKKTRTELSTSAINTNLPDNTQELITPTTERAQLTDERESVVNYKDDLGGVPNAGKFITVATDGESLTMVDEPQGDIQGSGVDGQITYWDGTKTVTSDAMLLIDTTNKRLKIVIPAANTGGGISLNAVSAVASSSLTFLNNGVTYAQLYYDNSTGNLRLASDGDVEINPSGTLSIDSGATFSGDIIVSKSGDAGINLNSTTTNGVAVTRYGTTATGNLWATGINITNSDSRWEIYNFGLASSPLIISSGGDATFSGNILLDGSNQIHFEPQSGEANTEAMRILRSADKMYFTYGINANEEAFLFDSSGVVSIPNGIVFNNNSVTGDKTSVTLNAYEEGTYTATMTCSTSGTITLASNTLSYTRIGRVVNISGYLSVSSVSSPTGIVKINLPFTQSGSAQFPTAANVRFNNIGSSYSVTDVWAQCSNSEISIYEGQSSAVGGTNFASKIITSCDVRIGVTYFTNN